jgi:hypothetical protein
MRMAEKVCYLGQTVFFSLSVSMPSQTVVASDQQSRLVRHNHLVRHLCHRLKGLKARQAFH